MKPLLLDLFCGAGGCAKGYADAGFSIIGVDKEPQKRYPYTFIQMDVFEYMQTFESAHAVLKFSVIHASPPCQRYSVATKKKNRNEYPDFIPSVRNLLQKTGLPYVIENVSGAPLLSEKTVTLCGVMFNLGVFRHRLFETNFSLSSPSHIKHPGRIGDGKYFSVAGGTGRWKSWGSVHRNISKGTITECKRAMGIDWMIRKELVQAIPPAYTEYIGRQLLNAINGCESNITESGVANPLTLK
jgi:DNA (cytosine-5)-methyltransferase 1